MNRWRCVLCPRYSRSGPAEYTLLGASLCEEHKDQWFAQIRLLNRFVLGTLIVLLLTLVLTFGGVL